MTTDDACVTSPALKRIPGVGDTVTMAAIYGDTRRWRRGKDPVPAGQSTREDGTPDYGIFGPGSMVWEVLLHPATVVFHTVGQIIAQDMYQPVPAAARDWEPISRKAREGTLTMFHFFERISRGAGMHVPMWLGDTPTAQHTAAWLHRIHQKVRGDLIDASRPELGGYAAAEPRDAMWAALTEMHPMLRMYEAFAFRDGRLPHRLTPEQRDQFIAEVGAYCALHDAPSDEIPTTMAELSALYDRYEPYFVQRHSVHISPQDGVDVRTLMLKVAGDNFSLSQLRAIRPVLVLVKLTDFPARGAFSAKARRLMGMGPVKSAAAAASTTAFLPLAWLLQQPPIERHYLRLLWGSDAAVLFENARTLHAQALAQRGAVAPGAAPGVATGAA